MKHIAYHVEQDGVICIDCSDNSMYNLITTPVYADEDAYPDGYTCTDCGDTFDSNGDKE